MHNDSNIPDDMWAFWLLAQQDIVWYLMTNKRKYQQSHGNKADHHIMICKMFIALKFHVPIKRSMWSPKPYSVRIYSPPDGFNEIILTGSRVFNFIHDHSQSLTDNLDSIGLTIDDEDNDYGSIAEVFCVKFYELAEQACEYWEDSKELDCE